MKPSIGRIVHYTLSASDVHRLTYSRTVQVEHGMPVGPIDGYLPHAGDVLPMIITAVDQETVRGQVMLDCDGTLWVWAVRYHSDPAMTGTWRWPVQV